MRVCLHFVRRVADAVKTSPELKLGLCDVPVLDLVQHVCRQFGPDGLSVDCAQALLDYVSHHVRLVWYLQRFQISPRRVGVV